MRLLRDIHLYLGCIFAPMTLFFIVSGIWQVFGLQWPKDKQPPTMLTYLSTIHTQNGLKGGDIQTLTSPFMRGFVIAMALSLIITIVLGIVMAFRFGRGRIATVCLGVGLAIPVALAVLAIFRIGTP